MSRPADHPPRAWCPVQVKFTLATSVTWSSQSCPGRFGVQVSRSRLRFPWSPALTPESNDHHQWPSPGRTRRPPGRVSQIGRLTARSRPTALHRRSGVSSAAWAGRLAGHPMAWTAWRMTRVTTDGLEMRDRCPALTSVIHPSPGRDGGYDITDYYNVHPRLGTLGDFAVFLEAADSRGIRVIIDLVVNHTSDEHPWFQSARSSPDSPYRDWYVWSEREPVDR